MTDARGFTLLEVLVAVSLIAVGLLAMGTMSITSLDNVRHGGEDTTALSLAQQRIEWLRNHLYTSAALAPGTTVEGLAGDYAGYTRTTTILNDVPAVGIKRVTVTILSPSGRTVDLVSLIAQ